MRSYNMNKKKNRGLRITLALSLLLIVAFLVVLSLTAANADKNETTEIRSAVQHAMVTCYAIEGRYPPSLSYMTDHYGLHYDAKKYYVVYEVFAQNIMPEVSVVAFGGAA